MSSLCSVPKCTMSHIKAKRENFKSLPIFSIRRPEFAKSEEEKKHRQILTEFILSVRNPDDPKDNIKHQLHKESAGICSRHFAPEDIIHFKDLAKLRVGAIPTRHIPVKDDETSVAEIQEGRLAEYMEIDVIEVSYDEHSPGSSTEEVHTRKEAGKVDAAARKEKPKQKSIHQIVERIKEISSSQQLADSNLFKDGQSDVDSQQRQNNDTDEGLSMTGNSSTSLAIYANNKLNGGVPTKRSRGRPRKLNPDGSYATIQRKRPRLPHRNPVSFSEGDLSEASLTPKRPRGRPRKVKPNIVMPAFGTINIVKVEHVVETDPNITSSSYTQATVSECNQPTPTKRSRGRPRKIRTAEANVTTNSPLRSRPLKKENILLPTIGYAESEILSPKRPKGRPRKQVDPSDLSGTIVEFSHTLSSMQFNRRFGHKHPRNLIPEMCRLFYKKGWMPGTGGAMAIKHKRQDKRTSLHYSLCPVNQNRYFPEVI